VTKLVFHLSDIWRLVPDEVPPNAD